jgi:hypothetical protein
MSEDDDKLDRGKLERAWSADEPPAGFAARVTAAAESERAARGARPPRRSFWVGGALLATAAAIALALRTAPAPSVGERIIGARETLQLGVRGLAVAEPESALRWRVDGAAAEVEQTAGNVFYRVEKGGPFIVRTPAGEVRVRGTCFRVEVDPMKASLMQMGAGAAIATAVLVTVYEGKVILANEKGQTAIAAGESARASRGQAPSEAGDAHSAAATAALQAPSGDITREELLKRDLAQRTELEKLRAQVKQLESAGAQAASGEKKRDDFTNVGKDEVQQMAKDCRLKWDQPGINSKPETIGDEFAQKVGLTDAERAEANKVTADLNAQVTAQLRQLYIEVTGDRAGADTLTPAALQQEILEKSSEKDAKQAYYDISHERAGLQPSPASLAGEPPVERMMRLMTGLGDQYEQNLGKVLGPDLAHRMRTERGGWSSRSVSSMGCP